VLKSPSPSLTSYVTIRPNLVHLSLPPAPVSFSSFLGNSTKLAGLPRTWDGLELSSMADAGTRGSTKKTGGQVTSAGTRGVYRYGARRTEMQKQESATRVGGGGPFVVETGAELIWRWRVAARRGSPFYASPFTRHRLRVAVYASSSISSIGMSTEKSNATNARLIGGNSLRVGRIVGRISLGSSRATEIGRHR